MITPRGVPSGGRLHGGVGGGPYSPSTRPRGPRPPPHMRGGPHMPYQMYPPHRGYRPPPPPHLLGIPLPPPPMDPYMQVSGAFPAHLPPPPPGPPPHIEAAAEVVRKLKSDGSFDQLRKDLMAKLDTTQLRGEVEAEVTAYLADQAWSTQTNKIALREKLRTHLIDSPQFNDGVSRVCDLSITMDKLLPSNAVYEAVAQYYGMPVAAVIANAPRLSATPSASSSATSLSGSVSTRTQGEPQKARGSSSGPQKSPSSQFLKQSPASSQKQSPLAVKAEGAAPDRPTGHGPAAMSSPLKPLVKELLRPDDSDDEFAGFSEAEESGSTQSETESEETDSGSASEGGEEEMETETNQEEAEEEEASPPEADSPEVPTLDQDFELEPQPPELESSFVTEFETAEMVEDAPTLHFSQVTELEVEEVVLDSDTSLTTGPVSAEAAAAEALLHLSRT